ASETAIEQRSIIGNLVERLEHRPGAALLAPADGLLRGEPGARGFRGTYPDRQRAGVVLDEALRQGARELQQSRQLEERVPGQRMPHAKRLAVEVRGEDLPVHVEHRRRVHPRLLRRRARIRRNWNSGTTARTSEGSVRPVEKNTVC